MNLNEEIFSLFEGHWQIKEYPSGEFLSHIGDPVTDVYFVKSGMLRVGVGHTGGRFYNKTFVKEGMFYVNLYDFWLGRNSHYEIQCLEDSKVYVMPAETMDRKLISDDFVALKLQIAYLRQRYFRHEQRELLLQTMSAKERYIEFLKDYEDYEQRIPAYHIASYLGMTEISLSRIKKEISSNS